MSYRFRPGRDARSEGFIEFKMKTRKAPLTLQATYWGDERNKLFHIFVDGTRIATERLDGGPIAFVEREYAIPAALTASSAPSPCASNPNRRAAWAPSTACVCSPPPDRAPVIPDSPVVLTPRLAAPIRPRRLQGFGQWISVSTRRRRRRRKPLLPRTAFLRQGRRRRAAQHVECAAALQVDDRPDRARAPTMPFFGLHPKKFEKSARMFLDGFPGTPMYAVKSNPAVHVLDQIYRGGIRHFDTASLAEIKLVRERYTDAHCHFMAPVRIQERPASPFTNTASPITWSIIRTSWKSC